MRLKIGRICLICEKNLLSGCKKISVLLITRLRGNSMATARQTIALGGVPRTNTCGVKMPHNICGWSKTSYNVGFYLCWTTLWDIFTKTMSPDAHPVTVGGRVFSFIILMIGLESVQE
jgi:hypothetical protein